MVTEYQEVASAVVDTFKEYPVVVTEGSDILTGKTQETIHAHLVQLGTFLYKSRRPRQLSTFCIAPATEATDERVHYLDGLLGEKMSLLDITVCDPQVVNILDNLKKNSASYEQLQEMGIRDILFQLLPSKSRYINEQFKELSHRLVYDADQGYTFIPEKDIPGNRMHVNTVNIANGNYVVLAGDNDVKRLIELCGTAYLPEDLNEYEAERRGIQKVAESSLEKITHEDIYVFQVLARKIGFEKTENAMGRRVRGLWGELFSASRAGIPGTIDELSNYLRRYNPILSQILEELKASFVPTLGIR